MRKTQDTQGLTSDRLTIFHTSFFWLYMVLIMVISWLYHVYDHKSTSKQKEKPWWPRPRSHSSAGWSAVAPASCPGGRSRNLKARPAAQHFSFSCSSWTLVSLLFWPQSWGPSKSSNPVLLMFHSLNLQTLTLWCCEMSKTKPSTVHSVTTLHRLSWSNRWSHWSSSPSPNPGSSSLGRGNHWRSGSTNPLSVGSPPVGSFRWLRSFIGHAKEKKRLPAPIPQDCWDRRRFGQVSTSRISWSGKSPYWTLQNELPNAKGHAETLLEICMFANFRPKVFVNGWQVTNKGQTWSENDRMVILIQRSTILLDPQWFHSEKSYSTTRNCVKPNYNFRSKKKCLSYSNLPNFKSCAPTVFHSSKPLLATRNGWLVRATLRADLKNIRRIGKDPKSSGWFQPWKCWENIWIVS